MKMEFTGPLSGLRQFLTNESPLKMMKNVFYFTLKALSVFKEKLFCEISYLAGFSVFKTV